MKDVQIITTDSEFNFSDADGQGTTVSNQFHAKDTIHAIDADGNEIYIPFHAVLAESESIYFESDKAPDSNCEEGVSCDGIFVFYYTDGLDEPIVVESGDELEVFNDGILFASTTDDFSEPDLIFTSAACDNPIFTVGIDNEGGIIIDVNGDGEGILTAAVSGCTFQFNLKSGTA